MCVLILYIFISTYHYSPTSINTSDTIYVIFVVFAQVLVSEVRVVGSGGQMGAQRVYKVCDFGLSRMLADNEVSGQGQQEENENENDDGGGLLAEEAKARDITGKIGTSLYMAPEVIANNKAELDAFPFASDMYSYAVMAWQVLSGERPYVNEPECQFLGLRQIKEKVVGGLRPEIPQYAGWPEGFAPILERCWAASAGDRPKFDSLVTQLQELRPAFSRVNVLDRKDGQMKELGPLLTDDPAEIDNTHELMDYIAAQREGNNSSSESSGKSESKRE
jgi:serine/threonine protein kinase